MSAFISIWVLIINPIGGAGWPFAPEGVWMGWHEQAWQWRRAAGPQQRGAGSEVFVARCANQLRINSLPRDFIGRCAAGGY